jgi:hypothetical protein
MVQRHRCVLDFDCVCVCVCVWCVCYSSFPVGCGVFHNFPVRCLVLAREGLMVQRHRCVHACAWMHVCVCTYTQGSITCITCIHGRCTWASFSCIDVENSCLFVYMSARYYSMHMIYSRQIHLSVFFLDRWTMSCSSCVLCSMCFCVALRISKLPSASMALDMLKSASMYVCI